MEAAPGHLQVVAGHQLEPVLGGEVSVICDSWLSHVWGAARLALLHDYPAGLAVHHQQDWVVRLFCVLDYVVVGVQLKSKWFDVVKNLSAHLYGVSRDVSDHPVDVDLRPGTWRKTQIKQAHHHHRVEHAGLHWP